MKPTTPAAVPRTSMGELLAVLSLASDLGMGLPMEHGVRSCFIGMRLADELEIPARDRSDLYYASLIKEVGCVCGASQLAAWIDADEMVALADLYTRDPGSPRDMLAWMARHVAAGQAMPTRAKRMLDFLVHGKELEKQGASEECEMGRLIARRLAMSPGVQAAVGACLERWDGRGAPAGLKGDAIPVGSRLLNFASTIEIFHRLDRREAAREVAVARRGRAFDPAIVDAFLAIPEGAEFWDRLEGETLWDVVLQMVPDAPGRHVDEHQLEAFAAACADLADAKHPAALGHSRRVSGISGALARRLGMSETEATYVRRAALMHDLGIIGVPAYVLARRNSDLSTEEQEKLRLHPYHAERILSRAAALQNLALIVGAHHERVDGQGYYRGLSGRQIPLAARVIAVADGYDDVFRAMDEADPPPGRALRVMEADPGAYDIDVLQALREELGAGPSSQRPRRREWPAGLTDREVEVLRLLTTGLSRRQIAARLVIAEPTIRHHIEHIYGKLDVNSRAGAVLFAAENDLL